MSQSFSFKEHFFIPQENGNELTYFCGNSLGLQPKGVADAISYELKQWSNLGVEGHFKGEFPWVTYHEPFADLLAPLVGAKSSECVCMNSLSVNLHLLLAQFYKPKGIKRKIIIEKDVFPSDLFAVQSQIEHAGLDVQDVLVQIENEDVLIDESKWVDYIENHQDEVALVLVGGVNYLTGQFLNLALLAETSKKCDIVFGIDLAHAIGNVPLSLHDWEVDFAVWCSYKYLNGGPGVVGGAFIHEKHHDLMPEFRGWWGTEKSNRFLMEGVFHSSKTADAWQLSNAPVMAMASLRPSLLLFQEAGFTNLRAQSVYLTGLLYESLSEIKAIEILTPSKVCHRGCQLSLYVANKGKELEASLRNEQIIVDWRNYKNGGIIRVAPTPMYNTEEDVLRFVEVIANLV